MKEKMKINYITGPAGCGKSTHLTKIERQARRVHLDVMRLPPDATQLATQEMISAARSGTIFLIDEGEHLNVRRRVDYAKDFKWPTNSRLFIANQGEQNYWGDLS